MIWFKLLTKEGKQYIRDSKIDIRFTRHDNNDYGSVI
jgi:hypothetical protein